MEYNYYEHLKSGQHIVTPISSEDILSEITHVSESAVSRWFGTVVPQAVPVRGGSESPFVPVSVVVLLASAGSLNSRGLLSGVSGLLEALVSEPLVGEQGKARRGLRALSDESSNIVLLLETAASFAEIGAEK